MKKLNSRIYVTYLANPEIIMENYLLILCLRFYIFLK